MKLNQLLFLFVFVMFTFSICCAQRIFNDQDAVPPSFASNPGTLLLVKLPDMEKENENLGKAFEKNYRGKYIVIDREELGSFAYDDLQEYGYTFEYTATWVEASGTGDSRLPAHYIYSAHVVNRATSTVYGVDFHASNCLGFFKDYAARLDAEINGTGK